MTVQLTVIGLGKIGTSIGLALSKQKEQITRVGHDRDNSVVKKAQKINAFDQIINNLPAAVNNADIVILAIPVDEIRDTLEIICPIMKPGSVLMDTSNLIVPVQKWVEELLPEDRYFVSISPSINAKYLLETQHGIEAAQEDLFKNSLMTITSSPKTDQDAFKLASDLTKLLGARVFFADPHEIDGLYAANNILPKIVSAAYFLSVIDQPGWREGRKIAGNSFAMLSEPITHLDERKSFGFSALLNRENTLRVIDNLIGSLQNFRKYIAENDEEMLTDEMERAVDEREAWIELRSKGTWDMLIEEPEMPTTGETFGRLFGLGGRKKSKS